MKNVLSIILLTFVPYCIYAQLTGKVVRILDGDTFVLLTQDTMQVFTSDMIFGKQVKVEEKGKDRYGRMIGMTYVNRKCLNEELLRAGLAWHYVRYDTNNPKWTKLQKDAEFSRKGLWSEDYVVAPWEWRMAKRRFKVR